MRHLSVVIAGLMLLLGSRWVTADESGRPRSGQAIYEDVCFRCHGLRGEGDGPDAHNLRTKPANFRSSKSRSKTDFQLLEAISYGIAGSPMHPWHGKLSDEEILEAVRYVRQLAPANPDK